MIKLTKCATPSEALERLGEIAYDNDRKGRKTAVFCDSKLTIEAEKAICDRIGGTFDIAVYTFSGYLSRFSKPADVLSRQQSVMVIRKIIDENKDDLRLFEGLFSKCASDREEKPKDLYDGVGVDAVNSVYDTISRFYASGITPEDLKGVFSEGEEKSLDYMLREKIEFLYVVFSEYEKYLEEKGKKDKNGRLSELAELLKKQKSELENKDVVFFGYQEFSNTGKEIIEAAMKYAGNVNGIFLDGEERLYSHVASESFVSAATEMGMMYEVEKFKGKIDEKTDCRRLKERIEGADRSLQNRFRKVLFDPSERREDLSLRIPADGTVFMYEAQDGTEEMEYIAAQIKKNICELGKDRKGDVEPLRYSDIAVMVPDVDEAKRDIEKIFTRYDIPYYVDTKRSLLSHPLYAFVQNFVMCAYYGSAPSYVDDIVASPYFPGSDGDKLAFRNYMAHYGKYKGAVGKGADEMLLMSRIDADATEERKSKAKTEAENAAKAVNGVCETLRKGLGFFDGLHEAGINKNGIGKKAYEGAKALFMSEEFNVKKTSESLCKLLKEVGCEGDAQFFGQAPDAILSIMKDAAVLDDGLSLGGYLTMLKGGIDAKKIERTPIKLDAVFVCDISRTLCMDNRVLFAARMTEEVPAYSHGARFISDEDVERLAAVMPELGPTSRQDNSITRETVALNVSSFMDRLYLGFPVIVNGNGHQGSEVLEYAVYAFRSDASGNPEELKARKISELESEDVAYYCSEPVSAFMWTERNRCADDFMKKKHATVKNVLKETGSEKYGRLEAAASVSEQKKDFISLENGKRLYCSQGDKQFPPTTLEEYFVCPYRAFMKKGLMVGNDANIDTMALDIGNLYHETFREVASEYLNDNLSEKYGHDEIELFKKKAVDTAKKKINEGPLKVLKLSTKGEYDLKRLLDEIGMVAGEMFEQLYRSEFHVAAVEHECEIDLDDGYSVKGIADRVDKTDGDKMVRIIDYKTGPIEVSCRNYYSGVELQTMLYLLAESEDGPSQAAGAFYLPARCEYSSNGGKIVLKGFADGTGATMDALDKDNKSDEQRHMDAKCPKARNDNGKTGKNYKVYSQEEKEELQRRDFEDFLKYGKLLAFEGANEMSEGYIKPSPSSGACAYCKFKGCCGFELGKDGEERTPGSSIYFNTVVNAVRTKENSSKDKNVG